MPPPVLNFLQLNMHRAFVASTELNKKAQLTSQICMITEPCTVQNKICYVPKNYSCVPATTQASRPRTAIYIPRHLPYVFLEQLSNCDCTVVLVDTICGKLLLASVYLDYKKPVVQEWLEELIRFIDTKHYPALLALDANAHTEFYGVETNARGADFEEFIIQNNLLVENKGRKPTYHAFRHGENIDTHIDFTLSKGLVPLKNWRVHDMEFNGSDHHTITWNIPLQIPPPPLIRPWLKAKWDVFHDQIAAYDFHTPENFTTIKTDKFLARWYKVIYAALDEACPKRPAKLSPVEMDWYGDDHKYLHNRVKRKYLAHRKSHEPNKRKAFVKAKKAYQKACRTSRRQSWRIFVEKTPDEKNMSSLFRIAQRRERRNINTLKKADGSLTEPGTDTIHELTRAHFPAASSGKHSAPLNSSNKIQTNDLDQRYEWITPSLVRRSMSLFKPNKAAGPDELKPLVFKHLPDNAINALTTIYKACVALGHTPDVWRETKVIFLAKPGKTCYDIPKSYRPISLSNYLLKVLERLVVWKMDEDLRAKPIHEMQHGFTKGKSTESAISNTANYIEQQLFEGYHCLGVFLDISSAFDSISIDHIRQSLLDHNGDQDLVTWYHSYLERRFIEITLHGESTTLTTSTGFPQGGVCSARFWLIAFDEAIKIINSEGIIGNGYADDCSALIGGTHPHNMIEKMQSMLDRLVAWGNSCGLQFNPQKTVAILFSRSTKPCTRPVRMNGQLIPLSPSVVYLGVTLDRELKWHIHIHSKIKKAKALLMKMACITHNYWGPKPKLMRWMFTGMVRPVISYAAVVWAHQADHPDMIEALRTLTRAAINTMVKVPRSTPNQGLEVILNILPLHLHLKQTGLMAYNRLFQHRPMQWEGVFTNLTNSISHLRYWQYLAQDAELSLLRTDSDECQSARPAMNFVLDTDSFVDMESCQDQVECNVYTDGSKIADKVGAGVFISRMSSPPAKFSFRLPNESTVYQAEMAAIREAAVILGTFPDLSTVKFFVDSQAALRTFQSDFIKSKLALQTISALNNISAESITFVWTKAHVGTLGNEEADVLAKLGTELTSTLDIPAPSIIIKNTITSFILSSWENEWTQWPEARQTKIYHPSLNKSVSLELLQWPKLKLGRYIRAVTGHNNLLYHLHNIPTISPICRFCLQANEEFHHLATDCPPLWWERHLISAQDPDHVHDWTIHQIISFALLPPINTAFIRPLFPIDRPQSANESFNLPDDNPDDPISMSDESESDISVMNVTSEPESSEDEICIDDPQDQ